MTVSRLLTDVFLASLACAVLCTFVLDVSTVSAGPDASKAWFEAGGAPAVRVVSTLLMWAVVLLVLSVTARIWISCALVLTACTVVSLANWQKLEVRNEPVYPSDLYFLSEADFLSVMVSPAFLVAGILGVGFALASAVWIGRRLAPSVPNVRHLPTARGRRGLMLARIVSAGVAITVLVTASQFNDSNNPVRSVYEEAGVAWAPWRPSANYAFNGFVPGLLFNTETEAMSTPMGYSASTMDEVADRWEARAKQLNESRATRLVDVNVITVLSETFSDPMRLAGFTLDEDPIANVRRVMSTTPSGTMVGRSYGAGTANAEFAVLTGMWLGLFSPQLTTPYQMLVPRRDQFPSAARYFASLGHTSIAVHPNDKSMYRRSTVYPHLGFERFLGPEDLGGLEAVGDAGFPSDRSTFREVRRLLDENSTPLFLNVVTMQNHFPYAGVYPDPVQNDLSDSRDRLGHYARGLQHSDQATHKFLERLAAMPEKSVVVFYGDHLPGIYDRDVQGANQDSLRSTPFFIWANFGDLEQSPLGQASPNFFLPLMFDVLDVPLPAHFALLHDLHEAFPTLNNSSGYFSQGVERLSTNASLRERQLLRDLELVQYDLSMGEGHVAGRMWAVPSH